MFGDIWCAIWLAVDVWMCTASILNLCAISLDRYVAVTRPVNYPSIMSSSRAKYLIGFVWVLSFIICFPPLVGWKDVEELAVAHVTQGSSLGTVRIRGSHTVITGYLNSTESPNTIYSYHTNFSEHILSSTQSLDDSRNLKALIYKNNEKMTDKLTKTDFHVVKRAILAFSGVREFVESTESSFVTDSTPLQSHRHQCPWICELTNDPGYVIYSALGSFFIPMIVMLFFYWRIYRAAVLTTRAINQGFRTTKGKALTNDRVSVGQKWITRNGLRATLMALLYKGYRNTANSH